MPKYQYQCKDCGEALEVQQSFTDDALTVCATCEGDLRKVFNAVGVVFKGSGFYRNDSRPTRDSKDSPKTPAKDSSPSAAGSSPADSAVSSSKPAEKSGKDSAA